MVVYIFFGGEVLILKPILSKWLLDIKEMMDRKRMSSRVHETMPYPNRVWEQTYPVRHARCPDRIRESDSPYWREHKNMVSVRNDKDGGLKIRERSSRVREWKDEDYQRREKAEKVKTDLRRREKDKKVEDHYHNSTRKDEIYCEREVEDKQRPKHSYDDHRSRRAIEKDNNQFIDNERQHKENEDSHAHEKRYSNNERGSRTHNSRSNDFDRISKDMHKERTRKNKDSEAGVQYSSGHNKRKHEDTNREKVSSKLIDEQQKQHKETFRREDENEVNRESKRGRSKVECWSNDIKEVNVPASDDIIISTNELIKPGGNSDASHPDSHPDPETLEKL